MKSLLREILDFIIKNKYIITFVVIVVFLYAIGLLKVLTEIVVLVLLVALAIFFGKKLQDGNTNIKDIFKSNGEFRKEGNVYYYQEPSEKKTKNTKKKETK